MQVVFARQRTYGTINYFDPGNKEYRAGDLVILEINKLRDYGKILISNHEIDEKKINKPLPKVVRLVNNFDKKKIDENTYREERAFISCQEYILKKNLPMHLIAVEYSFDRKKLKFYFTSLQKVDFRSLVKELVEQFKTGVELRQIGVRDASKVIGGIGICGRKICCYQFLNEFKTINLKLARAQNVLSSPEKISGICGRLRCCLRYELDNYEENIKDLDLDNEEELEEIIPDEE